MEIHNMHINSTDALNFLKNVSNTLTPKIVEPNALTSDVKTGQSAVGSGGQADKDVFLKLLVEQLKNQDPLAPQDGAQFVAQLAQFNSLEQLTSINAELGQLLKLNSPKQ